MFFQALSCASTFASDEYPDSGSPYDSQLHMERRSSPYDYFLAKVIIRAINFFLDGVGKVDRYFCVCRISFVFCP